MNHSWSHTTRHTRSKGFVHRCGQESSGNVSEERGQAASGTGRADQPWSQLEPDDPWSCRRSRGPSTFDSFGERSESSCDGRPQPLAVESIAKTSAWLGLIIVRVLLCFPVQRTQRTEQFESCRQRGLEVVGGRSGEHTAGDRESTAHEQTNPNEEKRQRNTTATRCEALGE